MEGRVGGLSPDLPTLHTDRLTLVPVADEHLAFLVALNADPEVMAFIRGRAATPEETLVEWDQRRGPQSDVARGLGYWVGFTGDGSAGEFVGWWSASSFAADPSVAGLGYRLRRAAWGRGLATEGARATVDQAFGVPGVERVLASTMAVNTASRAVLARVGLRHTDSWVQEWEEPVQGWEQGEVLYEISRAEWAAAQT
ncbi:GNAT family N-acetyltransferase [Nocardioides sp. LS1]|uniref:GNAT family N-acetyltransferase n=1 Tax=Nocardioides sp. LS1 TaxID=1027620 RepID=UPI001C8C80CD|nr:GNAT family N-acetyltransferase [Nocardioides sp. LS1]